MREIKFRAWDAAVGEMNHKVLIGNTCVSDGNYTAHCIHDGANWANFDEHDDITLLQFTGLKDKNGVEIYEGDLIKNQRGRTAEVVWHKFTASFDSRFVSDDGSAPRGQDKSYGFHNADWKREIKVIGNIYQNQELIENTNK